MSLPYSPTRRRIDPIQAARCYYRLMDITRAPIDLDPLLKKLWFEVHESGVVLEGLLVRVEVEYRWWIVVNSALELPRRRFVIAHELGHYACAHPLTPVSLDALATTQAVPPAAPAFERDANRFAAELLMPPMLFRELAERYADNPRHRLANLADDFAVSPGAVRARMNELRIR